MSTKTCPVCDFVDPRPTWCYACHRCWGNADRNTQISWMAGRYIRPGGPIVKAASPELALISLIEQVFAQAKKEHYTFGAERVLWDKLVNKLAMAFTNHVRGFSAGSFVNRCFGVEQAPASGVQGGTGAVGPIAEPPIYPVPMYRLSPDDVLIAGHYHPSLRIAADSRLTPYLRGHALDDSLRPVTARRNPITGDWE